MFVNFKEIQHVYVTEVDLLRRLTLGFNELDFNTSEQNKK